MPKAITVGQASDAWRMATDADASAHVLHLRAARLIRSANDAGLSLSDIAKDAGQFTKGGEPATRKAQAMAYLGYAVDSLVSRRKSPASLSGGACSAPTGGVPAILSALATTLAGPGRDAVVRMADEADSLSAFLTACREACKAHREAQGNRQGGKGTPRGVTDVTETATAKAPGKATPGKAPAIAAATWSDIAAWVASANVHTEAEAQQARNIVTATNRLLAHYDARSAEARASA